MTREEAIEALTSKNVNNSDIMLEALDMAIEALKQKPKTGHWIDKEHYFERCWARCSICGRTASGHSKDTGWGFTYSYTDYCPNCGAKMEGEEKE